MVRRQAAMTQKLQMPGGEEEVLQPNEIKIDEKKDLKQIFKRLAKDTPATVDDLEKDPSKALAIPNLRTFKMETNIKGKKLIFDSHYNEVQLKMHEENLGAFKQVKIDSFWVRNFMIFFLLRYVLFCISLVTLQHLHIF